MTEDITGLLERVSKELEGVTFPDRRGALVRDLAVALERLARSQTRDAIIDRLRAENAEMRRTFGSHPLLQEKDREIARMLAVLTQFEAHYPMGTNPWCDEAASRARCIIRLKRETP